VPFCGALGIASAVEYVLRRTGHPDHARAHGWRVAVPVIFALCPAIVLPLWLLSTMRSVNRDIAPYVAGDTRPIVASDTAGFCAPPVWGMRQGLPEVTLTVRPRTPGPHRISLDALDYANHRFEIDDRRELSAGANKVTLGFKRVGDTKEPIWWPIRVYDLTLIDEGPDRPEMIDSRRNDSLFVFDAEGLRPAPPAAPTNSPARP
jgi:hypothetical protein